MTEPTPSQLAHITPWSAEDWQAVYQILGHRPDWPELVEVAIDKGWHPAFLVVVGTTFEPVVRFFEEHVDVLRSWVSNRYLFPQRRAVHTAYRQRQLARARRRRR